jgi:hypothetical protein
MNRQEGSHPCSRQVLRWPQPDPQVLLPVRNVRALQRGSGPISSKTADGSVTCSARPARPAWPTSGSPPMVPPWRGGEPDRGRRPDRRPVGYRRFPFRRRCPILLDRAGQGALLPLGRAQLPDDHGGGGMPALHAGGDGQQVVPHAGDQVGVEPAGQQRPDPRVPVREVGSRARPVQGDLAEVADARDQVDQVEQGEGRPGTAVTASGWLEVLLVGHPPGKMRDQDDSEPIFGREFTCACHHAKVRLLTSGPHPG